MRSALSGLVLLLLCVPAGAQFAPEAGTLNVTVTLQHTHVDAHTGKNGIGRLQHNIDLRSISANVAIDYAVTDRLGLGVSVPYIQSRYRGPAPHPGISVDDGSMHGSLQDLQLDASYAMLLREVVVSPFAAFRYPTHGYATMGHAAPGRGLKELDLGFSAAHQFIALPRAFAGANVSHTISEAVERMRVNRTNAGVQFGYALNARLVVHGFARWQRSHDGVDIPMPPTSEWFHHHDQLARSNYTRGGAGLTISMTERVGILLGYATVIKSSNSHVGRSVSLGTSWSFPPRERLPKPWTTSSPRAPAVQEASLY